MLEDHADLLTKGLHMNFTTVDIGSSYGNFTLNPCAGYPVIHAVPVV
ncbi:hypothetical protein [Paenibacillus sp. FSL R5-0519]